MQHTNFRAFLALVRMKIILPIYFTMTQSRNDVDYRLI